MQKTSQFKTQCKGDISHAFKTAKITVFDPTLCKTPDAPLQNELLCWKVFAPTRPVWSKISDKKGRSHHFCMGS